MSRDYKLSFDDILDSIKKIEKYTSDFTLDEFINDDKTFDAVIRNFEIIGEASQNIPLAIQDKYTNIAWREIKGMRNILIHEYFGVDYKVVYKTIKEFIPILKISIQKILRDSIN
ncbi:MAG: DUF86 domain-containing protein [Candidatus Cloacimonetes bacterium]|nr:DUF86 domain-containing protein [Candidatus Cloacimonadota bacterium]